MVKAKKKHPKKPRRYKTILEARYKPSLEFYDLLFSAAQQFDEYPHWSTDRLKVQLYDYEKRCSLRIGFNSFAYDQDSDALTMEQKNIDNITEKLPNSLGIAYYRRLGFRRKYLIRTDMSFEELVAVMNLKLLSQDDKLLKSIPSKVDDLMYRVDASDDSLKYHLTMGPVRKKEIPNYMGFNKDQHLDPNRKDEDYLEIINKYPEVAIFIDLDIYLEDDKILTNETPIFVKNARKRLDSMANDFSAYLL